MRVREIEALARRLNQPLVLVSLDGAVLVCNASASSLCPVLAPGGSLAEAMVADPPWSDRVQAWSRHGSPVPTRLTLQASDGVVELTGQVARVDTDAGPALLVELRPDQKAAFAQLSDRVQLLRRELSYRISVERERAATLAAERAARGRLERIQLLSAALAGALDVGDVLSAIAAHASAAVGADDVVVATPGDDVLVLAVGAADAAWPAVDAVPLDAEDPLAGVARDRAPWFAEDGSPGPVVGALPLVSGEDGSLLAVLAILSRARAPLDHGDRAAAELVALLGSQALDRARLYERDRRFAEALQWALLPKDLPDLEGLDLAVEYLPASEHAAVGGDWYDIVPIDEDRLALVVGDVAGHGPAAATSMAQMRNALRAFVTNAADPGEALGAFNDYLCRQLPNDLATVVCVLVDRTRGRLEYANAGHLPPVLLGAGFDGFLREASGPPVGVTPDELFATAAVDVAGPLRIVCYSDGLIERRDEPIDLGMRRLERLARAETSDARALCDHIVGTLVGDTHLADDAVLVVADITFCPGSAASGPPAPPAG